MILDIGDALWVRERIFIFEGTPYSGGGVGIESLEVASDQ
jgi:hypothetical protein